MSMKVPNLMELFNITNIYVFGGIFIEGGI